MPAWNAPESSYPKYSIPAGPTRPKTHAALQQQRPLYLINRIDAQKPVARIAFQQVYALERHDP
jgi:hypothetical protein